jgi:hypothetical protein
MTDLKEILKLPIFYWRPKHLQHITENIVFKQRNVSFLAINALFRQQASYHIEESEHGNGHYIVEDFVKRQKNAYLRTQAEILYAVFYIDDFGRIVVTTAYSENDKDN